jgi:hypothetical protein
MLESSAGDESMKEKKDFKFCGKNFKLTEITDLPHFHEYDYTFARCGVNV